ncbi:MAG: DNA repair protein RadC [Planctomycetota bacterium]
MCAEQKIDESTLRYRRCLRVVEAVSSRENFDLEHVQEELSDERPGFVTKLVNELVGQGWLVREAASSRSYTWNRSRGEFSVNKWLDEKLFGVQVKVSPEQERPRERLLSEGADKLSTSELLAILVRSGLPGESAVMAGQKLAKKFGDRLADLPSAGRGELKSISPAVGKIAYCQIMAAVELGRRVAESGVDPLQIAKITGSRDAIAFCERHFQRLGTDSKQEEFHIVTLDTKNCVIDTHCITVGTLDASLVHPREVFRPAIKDAASSVILTHNHPSGDATPSPQDLAVTERLEQAGKNLGIDVLDHIVVASRGSISIREVR